MRFDLGHSVDILEINSTVTLDQWHTLRAWRHGRNASLWLDSQPTVNAVSRWNAVALDVKSPFYIGGVQRLTFINSNAIGDKSLRDFVGCIDQVEVRLLESQFDMSWDHSQPQQCPVAQAHNRLPQPLPCMTG